MDVRAEAGERSSGRRRKTEYFIIIVDQIEIATTKFVNLFVQLTIRLKTHSDVQ